ncbi:hypothetical protein LMG3410_04832 [Achromobacter aegrifaciens]|uniref:hypothetical protein n=1 Tax=Achromobacter aegrifaciens TaxID=1287736 RepID=UPI0014652B3F|nr:hypothetical protein [Achromobacter aegrifaciens]CAB3911070.1 hypothetical protein LMG3410_04832 [Achromobacter aegrifaciens]
MPLHPVSRDVFVRRTDPAGKRPAVITRHLVWDATLFLASQVKQYETEAKLEERQLISIATAAEYHAQHQKGH